MMRIILYLLLAGLITECCGCLANAPVVPVTPANKPQIDACQTIASWHNSVVVGDFVLGGATTGLAAVSALETTGSAKNSLAIAGAITGGLGVVGTAIAGFTAADFGNSQCSVVVGPLPAKPAPQDTVQVTVTKEER